MPEFKSKGVSIYYEIKGAGYPMVLISGFTCDHTLWMPIANKLAEHFQLILFDNRGVGRTQDDNAELSAELLAGDIRALVQGLGLKKPHIIGQSMGGAIAQKFASLYPEEIGKLGLLVTTAKWRQVPLFWVKSHLMMRQKGVGKEILIDTVIPWIFGEKFLQNLDNVKRFKESALANPLPQLIKDEARQIGILEQFDGREELSKIQAETLVMYGEEDLLVLPIEAKFLEEHIPNARLEGFSTGHGVILEASDELSRLMIQFFTQP